ncbi:MAG: hypothetical protein F6K31_08555 [Symploca sp. SIO2G7]|nr:hypothetical protein [Symploca sp. SIO2G7]
MVQNNQPHQTNNVQPIWQFCLLYIITFSFYQIPWAHKHWKFIKETEGLNITAWRRAWFLPLFLHSLCQKVLALAEQKGYRENPSPSQITFFYWVFVVLARLPDPLWLISLLAFVPLLTVVKATNYYWRQEQPDLATRQSFTGREVVWIVFGVILWALVIIGMFAPTDV